MTKDLQAFPCGSKVIGKDCSTGLPVFEMNPGMSLRDYFAIRAFQTRLAKYNDWTLDALTEQAYLDADAMLKARK